MERLLYICLDKFLLNRGAKVTAQLTGTHYRRSPIFQGGLEIPCLVTVTIPGSIKGHMLIQRYQQMIEELLRSERRRIMESFLEQIVPTEDEPRPKKKKTNSTTKKTEKPKGYKDIRNFFQNAVRPCSNKNSTRTIVID